MSHTINRDTAILGALKEELVGPTTRGAELDCSSDPNFAEAKQAYGPWLEKGSRQEILTREAPTKRYGVAVLYPIGKLLEDSEAEASESLSDESSTDATISQTTDAGKEVSTLLSDVAAETIQEIATKASRADDRGEQEDLPIGNGNAFRPGSMGFTFLATLHAGATLDVAVEGARYVKKRVVVAGKERFWWIRRPWTFRTTWTAIELGSTGPIILEVGQEPADSTLRMRVQVFSRSYDKSSARMLTVTLINRTEVVDGSNDEHCLFQVLFSATVVSGAMVAEIHPYPDSSTKALDDEERSIQLLYRDAQTYAIGHGCSADWTADKKTIQGVCLPTFQTPYISSDVFRADGSSLQVSMAGLAGIIENTDTFSELQEVVSLYSRWIVERKAEAETLAKGFRATALEHITACEKSLARMQAGLTFLQSDSLALDAFRLANRAILLQQVRGLREPRQISFDNARKTWHFSEPFPPLSYERTTKGNWRAFQIAFLLMTLKSAVDGDAADRRDVELIWFPTGGGKTEAYLGLAAFAMFLRRLRNPSDIGVNAIMRYTLRLLTAQQFQRASGLIVAMEHLRRKAPDQLGTAAFSIGIWLGGSTTPNLRAEAVEEHKKLSRGEGSNKFILSRCPWCGAQMGLINKTVAVPHNVSKCPGYERQGTGVILKCTDRSCEFFPALPVFVIDEDIYEQRPTLVIGTVDKFAMLSWKPQARSLFGLAEDGTRLLSPPGLIIQDELHLISGPLGSMVGLYEAVIEDLCTDKRFELPIPPKLVSSTATIRRYQDQVNKLYGRDKVNLFPPAGLAASDSFFAHFERQPDGSLAPGRLYVGVNAPGLGSLQTVQVRTFTSLLQAPLDLPTLDEQDPWWTMLAFFNSLRELGTTLSLFQSDIPDRIKTLQQRYGLAPAAVRWMKRGVLELTGRLAGDEVQAAIDALDVPTTSQKAKPFDVCLASNIIEVGVDIERLSLMCVVGQPKTTSQYIQVTGRVGRTRDRPGLIVTIFSASKPRDRSHFERFRSYHEKLYAYVEPTSVTPFSPPALDRALHAVMAAFVRQCGSAHVAESPDPYPEQLMESLKLILTERIRKIDPDEESNFRAVFERRATQWKRWQRLRWQGNPTLEDTPLLRQSGSFAPPYVATVSWATPMSMRNVDAECEVEITQSYLLDAEEEG